MPDSSMSRPLFTDGATAASTTSPPDPHFKLDETEWLTKERGNTAVSAVLVKVHASSACERESEMRMTTINGAVICTSLSSFGRLSSMYEFLGLKRESRIL